MQILNAPETREAVEESAATLTKKHELLHIIFVQSVGGQEIAKSMAKFTRQYLHDFVHIACPNFEQFGLSTNAQCAVYESVFRLSHPLAFRSPSDIHVAYWTNEERLYQLCSVLSNQALGSELCERLFHRTISFDKDAAASASAAAELTRSPGRALEVLLASSKDGPEVGGTLTIPPNGSPLTDHPYRITPNGSPLTDNS